MINQCRTKKNSRVLSFKPALFSWIIVLIVCCLMGSISIYADALDSWNWQHPWPPANQLNDVAFGKGIYVAVGVNGMVLLSSNRFNWSLLSPITNENLNKVIYANSRFTTVGNNGTILTSVNGETWISRTSGISTHLNSVIFGGGQYVAVGDGGIVLTSPDGNTWTRRYTHVENLIKGIAYGNSIYVAVSNNGSLLTSPDAIGWTSEESGDVTWIYRCFYDVVFGNGVFVTIDRPGGQVYTSPDGLNWSKVYYISESLTGVAYENSLFVAVGSEGAIITSSDGYNWTKHYLRDTSWLFGVAGGTNGFVGVGYFGCIVTSTNGKTWIKINTNNINCLNSVAYGNSTSVAVGTHGDILVSKENGITWAFSYSGFNVILKQVVFGNSLFVAVGQYGVIITSPDGITWTRQTSGVPNDYLKGIAYGNSTFIAIGYLGTTIRSTDGIHWTSVSNGYANSFLTIFFKNSQFIAFSYNSKIYTSADGVTWNEIQDSFSCYNINDVAYGNSTYVAVGDSGLLKISTNGTDWTTYKNEIKFNLKSVAFGNSTFLAVADNGLVYSSLDGINWRAHQSGTNNWLNSVIYQDSRFITVGGGGTILISPRRFNCISGNTGKAGTKLLFTHGSQQSITANENGDYWLFVVRGWNGTITPVLEGYRFTPLSRNYNHVTTNQVRQNYTSQAANVTISGKITNGSQPLPGVTITFSFNNHQVTTDENGNYSYIVPYSVSTNVTPSFSNFSFTPSHYTYSILRENKTIQDFTATYIPPGSVEITSPIQDQTVNGTIFITAQSLIAGISLQKVTFFIDREKVNEDSQSPFQYEWDTRAYEDGLHTLSIEAISNTSKIYQHEINVIVNNSTVVSELILNRDRLNFGAIITGHSTSAQTFLISNSRTGNFSWQATPDQSWISVSPASGTGDGLVSVSINPTGLAAGQYQGTITVTDPGNANSSAIVNIYLLVKTRNQDQLPLGTFETPIDGATVQSSIPVTGWVIDDVDVTGVKIYLVPEPGQGSARVFIGDAVFVEGARPDVAGQYGNYPNYYKAGWGYMLLTYGLPNQGNGTYVFSVVATDSEGHEVILGTKTIICDNDNASKPFGAIDTPTQGGEVSGIHFVNQGWALTPQPNTIAKDGSTISVWLDGVKLPGHATYNNPRTDISSLFPGYNNSNGAAGYYNFDTTQYENGVHTISWTVTDNAGNTDGIGSRFFSIFNQTAQRSSRANVNHMNFSSVKEWVSSPDGVKVKKGFRESGQFQDYFPGEQGQIDIDIHEDERIEVHLNEEYGILPAGSLYGVISCPAQNHLLPIGSTFDPIKGIFYWHPGPGFIGAYDFQFIIYLPDGTAYLKKLTIKIQPKYY